MWEKINEVLRLGELAQIRGPADAALEKGRSSHCGVECRRGRAESGDLLVGEGGKMKGKHESTNEQEEPKVLINPELPLARSPRGTRKECSYSNRNNGRFGRMILWCALTDRRALKLYRSARDSQCPEEPLGAR